MINIAHVWLTNFVFVTKNYVKVNGNPSLTVNLILEYV